MHMEVGFSLLQWWRLDLVCSEFGSCGDDKHGRGPRVFAVVPFFFVCFYFYFFYVYRITPPQGLVAPLFHGVCCAVV